MQRPVGPGRSLRFSNRVAGQTTPEVSASLAPLLKRRDRVSRDGDSENGIQRGDHSSGNWDARLCVQHFLGPQERWGGGTGQQLTCKG